MSRTIKIKSGFASLDVLGREHACARLERRAKQVGGYDVVIRGKLTGTAVTNHDGTSQEFEIDVKSVELEL